MSIEDMIRNGATPEEINAVMQEIYLEKEREDKARAEKEALLKKEQAMVRAEDEARKEMLKREARAYIINGMFSYCEAFDLLEGEEPDEQDVQALEAYLMQIEAYFPIAKEIAKLRAEQGEKGFFDLFGGGF